MPGNQQVSMLMMHKSNINKVKKC